MDYPWIGVISYCIFDALGVGINMWWANHIGIITDCDFNSCGMYEGPYGHINKITKCTFDAGYIDVVLGSDVDIISYCIFENSPDYGLRLGGTHGALGSIGTISQCVFNNNMYGFETKGYFSLGSVSECDFTNNDYGIYVAYESGATNVGPIYHNNFIVNTQNAYEIAPFATWDNDYPSGGNYWDDYTGIDSDGDGIGDTPFIIPPNLGNEDRYPFMIPNGWNTPPNKPDTPTGQGFGGTGTSYPYTTSSIDPEGDKLKYGWDWDGDNIIHPNDWDDNNGDYYYSGDTITTYHQWTSWGIYNVKVIAEDIHGEQSVFSDSLRVIMPKDKHSIFNFSLLDWLFEQLPNLFPILRYIIGLQ